MNTLVSIEINRPIVEVFDFTVNHVVQWSQTIIEKQVIEDVNQGDVGTLFRAVTEDNGQRLDYRGTVIEHDPPRRSMVHLAGQYFDVVVEYQFQDLGDRTVVTQMSQFIAKKNATKFLFFALGWMLRALVEQPIRKDLESLKRLLESR